MSWLLIIALVWASVAVLLAVFIGRAVRIADLRDDGPFGSPVPDFVPGAWNSTAGTR